MYLEPCCWIGQRCPSGHARLAAGSAPFAPSPPPHPPCALWQRRRCSKDNVHCRWASCTVLVQHSAVFKRFCPHCFQYQEHEITWAMCIQALPSTLYVYLRPSIHIHYVYSSPSVHIVCVFKLYQFISCEVFCSRIPPNPPSKAKDTVLNWSTNPFFLANLLIICCPGYQSPPISTTLTSGKLSSNTKVLRYHYYAFEMKCTHLENKFIWFFRSFFLSRQFDSTDFVQTTSFTIWY